MPVTEPPPSRESVSDTEGMTVRVVVVLTNFFTLKEQNKGGRRQDSTVNVYKFLYVQSKAKSCLCHTTNQYKMVLFFII